MSSDCSTVERIVRGGRRRVNGLSTGRARLVCESGAGNGFMVASVRAHGFRALAAVLPAPCRHL
jgi:hypothetical protein